MKNKKVFQFIFFGLLSLVIIVFLGKQVYAHNIVPSIDRQLMQQLVPTTQVETLTNEDKLPLLVSSQYDNELLELINQERVSHEVRRWSLSPLLGRMAQTRVEEAASRDGRYSVVGVQDYADSQGYQYTRYNDTASGIMGIGELTAGGDGWTPRQAVEYWMNWHRSGNASDYVFRSTILQPELTEVGFGVTTFSRDSKQVMYHLIAGLQRNTNVNVNTSISGQWTYRAASFGPECSVGNRQNESIVTINQNGNQFTSSGGISVESRGTSNDAIGNGSISGSQIQSSTANRYVSWTGAINPDANTINGTATCVMGGGGTGRGSFPFTLTRRSQSSPNQTSSPSVTPQPSRNPSRNPNGLRPL